MHRLDNPSVVKQQYANSRNLEARIAIHERFSTHAQDWHRWMWERLDIPDDARVLELGCGTGLLWDKNRERIPAGWDITLSDLSLGMLTVTQELHLPARLVQLDAQAIPFRSGTFDAVLANHMLYHVPDLGVALGEIRRVLKPGGKLHAATNGLNHMHQLDELAQSVFDTDVMPPAKSFALENGQAILERYMSQVRRFDMQDGLEVTEAEPLVAYIMSMRLTTLKGIAEKEDRLRAAIAERIVRDGAYHIDKSPCLFEASAE